jgi:hypothetical protein
MAQLRLDPRGNCWAPHCSGTLVLATLGLLNGVSACTDLTTKPWFEEAGIAVLNQPFVAKGNVATGGGLASQYLAIWVIARLIGLDEARSAMHYVAPVGEKEDYIERAMRNVTLFSCRRRCSAPSLLASSLGGRAIAPRVFAINTAMASSARIHSHTCREKYFLMQITFAAVRALFLLNTEQAATEKVLNSKRN